MMESISRIWMNQRLTTTRIRPQSIPNNYILRLHRNPFASSRHASNSSSSNSKPIVLEKPDKFRPPSHPARLKARSTTATYGAGASYNQGMTDVERNASKTKTYPHMFPAEGTRMHWFLTTRWVHLALTLSILAILAGASMLQTFSKTSPFAHLLPSASRLLPWHPFTYLSELGSVFRLHMEYTTSQAAESRKANILDAQKRRLYRRAHGMEDLSADEVSGPDVRGLVSWDDGLTDPERQRGGQYTPALIGSAMAEMGQRPGESFNELMDRKRAEEEQRKVATQETQRRREEQEQKDEVDRLRRIGARGYRVGEEFGPSVDADGLQQQPRKRKVWLGIW